MYNYNFEEVPVMANALLTKEAFAQSLKDLIINDKIPFSEITVNQIVKHCGLARNTFYYHFRDKYELVNWIFYYDMFEKVDAFTNPSKLMESFVDVCRCLYTSRNFYFTCLQCSDQNSLCEYLYRFYNKLWEIHLNIRYSESGYQPPEHIISMSARLKARIMMNIISDWVAEGMKDNYLEYLENVRPLLEAEFWQGTSIPYMEDTADDLPMDQIVES